MVNIYVLIDPRTNEVRYVGKTKNALETRLAEHCSHAMTAKKRNPRHNWIRSLLRQGYVPVMELVQTVPEDFWQRAEIYWIAYYRTLGCPLTNSTEGGDGTNGLSAEARAKQSAAQKGRKDSPETRAKKAAHLRRVAPKAGYTLNLSDEERKARRQRTLGNQNGLGNKSRVGQKRSAEERAKQSATMQGHAVSAETRAKQSASVKRTLALKRAVQDWT